MPDFNYGPDLGDPDDEQPCVIVTVSNGKDHMWAPDIDIRTDGDDYNGLLTLLLNREGRVAIKHLKVKTDYLLKNIVLDDNHLTVLQQLSVSLSLLLFPVVATVLTVNPIKQKGMKHAS